MTPLKLTAHRRLLLERIDGGETLRLDLHRPFEKARFERVGAHDIRRPGNVAKSVNDLIEAGYLEPVFEDNSSRNVVYEITREGHLALERARKFNPDLPVTVETLRNHRNVEADVAPIAWAFEHKHPLPAGYTLARHFASRGIVAMLIDDTWRSDPVFNPAEAYRTAWHHWWQEQPLGTPLPSAIARKASMVCTTCEHQSYKKVTHTTCPQCGGTMLPSEERWLWEG